MKKTACFITLGAVAFFIGACGDKSSGCFSGPVTIQRYTDRAQFAAALGTSLRVVDFDDVSAPSAPIPFASDRYQASKGIVIKGTDGQYADRSFGYPEDYVSTSPPNTYAPGPQAAEDAPSGSGGHNTDVTFAVGEAVGCTSGFGAMFIDADYPDIGPSSLAVFDAQDVKLDEDGPITGPNADGGGIFRGMIAFDGNGKIVPAILRVHLVNGNEWPEVFAGEGAVLDDFQFGAPVAR